MTKTILAAGCVCLASITAGAQTDVSDIQDPAARAAAEAVMQQLAEVNEYTCTVDYQNVHTQGISENASKVEIAALCERNFRRPNLQRTRCENTKHIAPSYTGSVMEDIYDGTYWWHIQYADANAVRPRLIHQRPLDAFAEAGLTEHANGLSGEMLLRPFKDCKIETLTIDSETDELWIFKSEPRYEWPLSKSLISIKLTIGKSDGVLRQAHYDEGERGHRTVTVSNVELNPGLDDSVFQCSPPEGIAVEDNTKDLIESLVRQQQDWKEYEPPSR